MLEVYMKSTGMVRQVDELGRVVLPVELRTVLDIKIRDPLAFYVDEDMILLVKYEPGCVFCGEAKTDKTLHGKHICDNCLKDIKT
jgi:Regulators of stationary/sporulation gene expression